MSHEEVNLTVPVGSNWNEHSAWSATTTTLVGLLGGMQIGVGRFGQLLKHKEVVRRASKQPNMMIGLRPTLSDKAPKRLRTACQ